MVIQANIPGATASESIGAGVVVSKTGEILTALHVVKGATSIKVSFSDGTTSPATIQTSDAAHDIASLMPQHPPAVIVPAVLGGGVRIGDEVFAVGHPLGLVDSLTAGVVSGLDRTFKVGNGRTLTGLIQFDAAVNPGNSGGPLLNSPGPGRRDRDGDRQPGRSRRLCRASASRCRSRPLAGPPGRRANERGKLSRRTRPRRPRSSRSSTR